MSLLSPFKGDITSWPSTLTRHPQGSRKSSSRRKGSPSLKLNSAVVNTRKHTAKPAGYNHQNSFRAGKGKRINESNSSAAASFYSPTLLFLLRLFFSSLFPSGRLIRARFQVRSWKGGEKEGEEAFVRALVGWEEGERGSLSVRFQALFPGALLTFARQKRELRKRGSPLRIDWPTV